MIAVRPPMTTSIYPWPSLGAATTIKKHHFSLTSATANVCFCHHGCVKYGILHHQQDKWNRVRQQNVVSDI
jgi:hypothetical protein